MYCVLPRHTSKTCVRMIFKASSDIETFDETARSETNVYPANHSERLSGSEKPIRRPVVCQNFDREKTPS